MHADRRTDIVWLLSEHNLGGCMSKPDCFIVMPVTTRPEHKEQYSDADHWQHVMDTLLIPAIEAADMTPVPPVADGSDLIHSTITQNLSKASMVLCDLSSHNPNAFFELGVRTSLNLPIALVRDEHTTLPFDTAGINTFRYDSSIRSWDIDEDRRKLTQHLRSSVTSCGGTNPLWRQFGLTIRAQEPNTDETREEAKLDLILAHLRDDQGQMRTVRYRMAEPPSDVIRESHKIKMSRFQKDLDNTGLAIFVGSISPAADGSVFIELDFNTPREIVDEIAGVAGRRNLKAAFATSHGENPLGNLEDRERP